MSILDAQGHPVDPIEGAMARMSQELAESIYGENADQRVYSLRQSVLGDGAGPSPGCLRGLSEWLPIRVPVVVTGLEDK